MAHTTHHEAYFAELDGLDERLAAAGLEKADKMGPPTDGGGEIDRDGETQACLAGLTGGYGLGYASDLGGGP